MRKVFRNYWLRQLAVGLFAALLVYLFWISRSTWSPEMRFWRAVGDSGFILLVLTLSLGSLSVLFPKFFIPLKSWRRELGIWTALTVLLHTFLIFKGWFSWDLMSMLGYEYIPELERYARLEPGFGLANLLGLVALFFLLLLLATSTAKAVSYLGSRAWKYLHSSVNIIFYLVVLHVAYFMFIHFSPSFHRPTPPPNWFRYPFLAIAVTVMLLQASAYIKTVMKFRKQ